MHENSGSKRSRSCRPNTENTENPLSMRWNEFCRDTFVPSTEFLMVEKRNKESLRKGVKMGDKHCKRGMKCTPDNILTISFPSNWWMINNERYFTRERNPTVVLESISKIVPLFHFYWAVLWIKCHSLNRVNLTNLLQKRSIWTHKKSAKSALANWRFQQQLSVKQWDDCSWLTR